MICQYCGEEIDDGAIWCPFCGRENRMVPDYSLVEDTQFQEEVSRQKREDHLKGALEEKELERIRNGTARRRKAVIVVFTILIIGAMIGAQMAYTSYNNAHSYDYQLEKANEAFNAGDYETASAYADTASTLDSAKIAPWYILAYSYHELDDDKEAAAILEAVLQNGTKTDDYSLEDIYTLLCAIYDNMDEYDKLRKLALSAEDEYGDTYTTIFGAYLVAAPELSELGGNFEKPVTLSIRAPGAAMAVYYTLDGTEPATTSELYEEPIVLPEGETTVTAVCVDSNGHMSLPVTQTYEITLLPPDAPSVTPISGTYDESRSITVDVPEGCTAYYTWDGKEPTENSLEYTKPLDMPEGNSTFRVIAVDEYGLSSKVVTRNYVYLSSLDEADGEDADDEVDSVNE